MKRCLAFLLMALSMLFLTAQAEALDNEMTLYINGESIHLEFDPSPNYTSLANGYIQASYYAELDEALYELFMIFPARVHTGDVVSPEHCIEGGDDESGFLLLITTKDADITALATQDVIGTFPAGSGYAITFDDVADTEYDTSYTGTLHGTLVDVDALYNASGETHAIEGSFHFSTALTKEVPADDEAPAPTLDVPDNAQKI